MGSDRHLIFLLWLLLLLGRGGRRAELAPPILAGLLDVLKVAPVGQRVAGRFVVDHGVFRDIGVVAFSGDGGHGGRKSEFLVA